MEGKGGVNQAKQENPPEKTHLLKLLSDKSPKEVSFETYFTCRRKCLYSQNKSAAESTVDAARSPGSVSSQETANEAPSSSTTTTAAAAANSQHAEDIANGYRSVQRDFLHQKSPKTWIDLSLCRKRQSPWFSRKLHCCERCNALTIYWEIFVPQCFFCAFPDRTCLRYFLPPHWMMDKDAVSGLSPSELSNFPLDDFFDHYEKGLRKVRAKTVCDSSPNLLCTTRN